MEIYFKFISNLSWFIERDTATTILLNVLIPCNCKIFMKRILITGAAGFWDHIYVTVLLKKVILLLAWIISSLRFKKYRTPVQIGKF
jgi:hypothetical protein